MAGAARRMQGSMKEYTVNELGSVLACLNELYDKVRVVEPDTGCLCDAENGFAATSCTCNDEGRCLNCVGLSLIHICCAPAARWRLPGCGALLIRWTPTPW